MAKNQVHDKIPQNKQLSAQTQGDVAYKVKISDYQEEQAPLNDRLFTNFGLVGKGGGGGSGGQINGDVLHTDTYAKFVDIVSEGQIEGTVNGLNSILLNGTPLADENGNLNFNGVQVYPLYGTEDQKFPPMFQKSGSTFSVNSEVKTTQAYTFTVTDDSITSTNIIIKVPILSQTDDNGNINGTSVSFQITVNGKLVAKKTISGVATSPIEKGFVVNLRDFTGDKTVVVSRITPDSTDPKLQNKTFVASYTWIIDYTINYANRAGCALMFEAKQFGSQLPDRAYHLKGINTIKIPENYDPVARTYTGVWNGVFKTAYTNNPVWCLYDLLTNTRYGAGDYIDADQLDKFEMYDLAQYCDDMVIGLDGSMEPRFTFNCIITQREQALSLIKKIQGNFLAALFYFGGVIKLAQDKPEDATAIVTNANVVNGVFNYSTTELDKQTNTVVVSYNDPINDYKLTTETVYNNALLNQAGREVKKEVNAFGCTSRSQAHRMGKYMLLSDIDNAESVNYTAGLDHAKVIIGDIIEIHDNFIENTVSAGRIKSMSGVTIVLDRTVTLLAGNNYFIKIIDQNGAVEELTISNASVGTISTITVDDNKGFIASAYTVYSIKHETETDKQGTLYRILDIRENDKNTYDITANKYVSSKFDNIYSNNPVDVLPEQPLPPLRAPQNVQKISQNLYKDGKNVLNDVDFGWNRVTGATHYEYQYRIDSNEFTQVKRTNDNQFKIIDGNGVYDVRVRAVDLLNRTSKFSEVKTRVSTGDVIPSDVQRFNIHRSGSTLVFSWEEVPLQEYGLIAYYEIRQGTTWFDALTVFRTLSNSYTYTLNTGGTFLIKAVTIAGVGSANAASANAFAGDTNIYITDNYSDLGFPVSDPSQIQNFTVEQETFDFSNGEVFTFSNGEDFSFTSASGSRLLLTEFNYGAWNTLTNEWTTYVEPWVGDVQVGTVGIYETDVKNLGAVEDVFIHAKAVKSVVVTDLYVTDFVGLYVPDFNDDWYSVGKEEAAIMVVEMRFSTDGVSYSDYTEFVPGQYRGRYFQYRITLTAKVMKYEMYIDSFEVEYDIPDVIDRALITTGANGQITYTFTKTFHTTDLVVLGNPTDPSTNVTVKTLSKSLTQATFQSINQTTGAVAPNVEINVIIKGY